MQPQRDVADGVQLPLAFSEHDEQITLVLQAIRELMKPPESPPRRMGFRAAE